MDSHEEQPTTQSAEQTYQAQLAALHAEQQAQLERDLAAAARDSDPLHNDRIAFLMLLIRARQAKGWSQAELAKRLGMQRSALSRIESGRGNPGLTTLLKIAKVLDARLVLE